MRKSNTMASNSPSRRLRRRAALPRCHAVLSPPLAALLLLLLASAASVVESYDTIEDHDCFRNLKGMTESMFDLAAAHPELSSVVDVGDSYLKGKDENNEDYPLPQNGYDIYAMIVTASESESEGSTLRSVDKGKTLIVSGVHPREYAPPELAMRFAEYLLGGYGEDADVTWILENIEVHIIFYVNPDSRYVTEAYPKTFWRKNQNPHDGKCKDDEVGVDLNRNYDFMWGDTGGDANTSDDECDNTYHGRKAFSEPETAAVAEYARGIFPEGQRREDPEKSMDEALGEDIMGIFVDIHAPGGYIIYPWTHDDSSTPDDDALQATARKMSYFNGYKLWAGGQPDFQYATTGDSCSYMYAALGVAGFIFELGEDFYEDCGRFEKEVAPDNLKALTYLVKNAKKPFSLAKGPDIIDLVLSDEDVQGGIQYGIKATVVASDSRLVNSIDGYPDFPETGGQGVAGVRLYLDVHPDDFQAGDDDAAAWEMLPTAGDDESEERAFEAQATSPQGQGGFSAGRHVLYAQARDGAGYVGPATGAFFDVERPPTGEPTRTPSKKPTRSPTKKPTRSPSKKPTRSPSKKPSKSPTRSPVTASPSDSPTENPTRSPSSSPTAAPSTSPSTEPTDQPSSNPSSDPSTNPTSEPSHNPSNDPSTNPSANPSANPSGEPSRDPSYQPSDAPTMQPTKAPTIDSVITEPTAVISDISEPTTAKGPATVPSPSGNRSSAACSSVVAVSLFALVLSVWYLG